MPTLMRRPHASASRAARRGSSAARSSSHSRCSMCQSAGCSAMPAAKASAMRLRHRRDVGVRRPPGGRRPASRPAGTTASPAAASRRCAAPATRAGRHARRSRRRSSTSTPRADRSRSASRHSVPPASSRSTSTSNGGRVTAGQRQHLHAERLAEGDEPVVQRLRLQPLGDGREGHARGAAARRRRRPSCRCAAAPGRVPRPAATPSRSRVLADRRHAADDALERA